MQVELPYLAVQDDDLAYVQRRVSLSLDGPQSLALRRVLEGAMDADVTLTNGTIVKTPAHAVRHILELVVAGE